MEFMMDDSIIQIVAFVAVIGFLWPSTVMSAACARK